jgi:hypothetical protein
MTAIPYRQNTARWEFQLRRAREQQARILKRIVTHMDSPSVPAWNEKVKELQLDIERYLVALEPHE